MATSQLVNHRTANPRANSNPQTSNQAGWQYRIDYGFHLQKTRDAKEAAEAVITIRVVTIPVVLVQYRARRALPVHLMGRLLCSLS